MTAAVELRPGLTPLVQWRAVYRGAPVALDPYARPDVEAGAQALQDMLADGDAEVPSQADPPSLAELVEGSGDLLPPALARLFVALKLASLAQGMSGTRWETVRGLADFLAAGLLPAIPAAVVSDRLAHSYLFAALTGTGEVIKGRTPQPAAKALSEAGLSPLRLSQSERTAFLSGIELTTAAGLAGLFETERVLHSALVAAAFSFTAMRQSFVPLHPRVYQLRRQPGPIEVAALLRELVGSRGLFGVTDSNDQRQKEAAHSTPLAMGTCLDLLRHAGVTLESAANAVTEDRLVLWQTGEIVAGAQDASDVVCAVDLVARTLVRICLLSRDRMAALAPAPDPKTDTGGRKPSTRADGFLERMREQAEGTADPRRLLPMAGTAALLLAVELLQAASVSNAQPADENSPLSEVLRKVQAAAPPGDEDSVSDAGDFAALAERVASGALAAAVTVALPSIVRPLPEGRASG